MLKAGSRAMRLERLGRHRSEEDAVKLQGGLCCTRHGKMAAMRRIKATAEKCNPRAFTHGMKHTTMVML